MSRAAEDDSITSVWQGRRVRLRAMESADWETYFAWDQDSDQARNLDAVPFPRSREAGRLPSLATNSAS